MCSILVSTGCDADGLAGAVPSPISSDQVYWDLAANYKAINLALVAPYDTVRLEARPRNAMGEPLPGVYTPEYIVLDTVRLRVTEDGLIEARATGNGIVVVSKLQIGPVTHVDTTLVRVVAAAPTFPLDTLSIQPPALDSAIWSWGGAPKTLQPITKSTSGGNISGLQIAWTSSNKRVATVEANGATNAILTGWMVGKVWIRATTYAWGVALSDSVEYIIGYPAEQLIEVDNVVDPDGTSRIVFHPSTVTIGVGGVVTWDYSTGGFGLSIPGITFEQPDEAFGVVDYALLWPLIDARDGNVDPRERLVHPLTGSWFGASNMRFWKTPGVYTFRDNMNRGTGVVIVKGRPDV